EQYQEYKGGRNETPEEFAGQIELIGRVLEALNIPSVTVENYEADDIVATLAKTGVAQGYEVQIVSGDRDAFQLINDDVTILYPVTTGPTKGIRRMDAAAVEEKYKIPPHLYPDLAALTGEQADNLPGVPGVGPGFAAKWINEFGDLNGIIQNQDQIKGKKGEALREHLEDVLRNRRLNRLVDDLELPVALESLEDFGPRDSQELEDLFDELEFSTIRKRTAELFSQMAQAAAVQVELLVDEVKTLESADDFSDFIQSAQQSIGEVTRPQPVSDRLSQALVLLPIADEDAAPAGFAHEQNLLGVMIFGGDQGAFINLEEISPALDSVLTAWLEEAGAPKIVYDVKQQFKSFNARGVQLAGVIEDPLLSSYVCGHVPTARRRSFSAMMQDLCEQYLHVEFPEQDKAEHGQGELFSTEPAVDVDYYALVARHIQELAYALDMDLKEQNQLKLYEEIELPLATVLAQMEIVGIAVNTEVMAELKDYYQSFINQATQEAYSLIDHEVNLGSPKQLQAVLFEELELPTTRKLKSGFSTDAESMADLLTKVNPDSKGAQFLVALQMYRDFTKLKQTVEGLQKATAEDGRVHTTFQQNVAATGRLSSTDPNLQNIPIRTEEGRKIRDAFIVDPKEINGTKFATLLTADYSQIEMRIMVHLAQDEKLIQAYLDGEDLHRFVGSEVFGVAPENVTSEMRSKVKAMSYGLAYGLSRFGLSKQLGIPVDEAAELTVNYFKRFGDVGRFLRGTVKEAHKHGYTETMFGRRRILSDLNSSNRQRRDAAERAALNAPIQGTAADIMKIAMIGVQNRLKAENLTSRMLLQIHDELILEVAPGEEERAAQLLQEEMGNAVHLKVPMDVQVGTGVSWHQAGH
ncbi:MAG: DNA polymerase I, partial [Rothia sp. (in: high G+C Gram-positive bacteria)]|nr:DNA polymerase I [Rothia sp. (in: high G+C Gram-positive bacteria)]